MLIGGTVVIRWVCCMAGVVDGGHSFEISDDRTEICVTHVAQVLRRRKQDRGTVRPHAVPDRLDSIGVGVYAAPAVRATRQVRCHQQGWWNIQKHVSFQVLAMAARAAVHAGGEVVPPLDRGGVIADGDRCNGNFVPLVKPRFAPQYTTLANTATIPTNSPTTTTMIRFSRRIRSLLISR